MIQLMCCRAMGAILKVPEAGSTEEALGRMAQSLEAHAGTAWASWASKNI